jgi:hypothetical protein
MFNWAQTSLNLLATDVFGKVEGVGADIAHGANFPGFCRVSAPRGLGLAFAFEEGGEPACGYST